MAVRSEDESASTSARAAFRISSDSRRTLGLASITIATLADSVEASKYVRGCCTPSSNTRKSAICSPRTTTPSAPITLHVTGTICVTTEIACRSVDVPAPAEPFAPTPFAAPVASTAFNSPVTGSRFHVTSSSRRRGRGNFVFCCACREILGRTIGGVTSARTNTTPRTAKRRARRGAKRSWKIPRSRIARLVEVEIAQRFFDRAVFRLLQTLGEFSRQHVFLRFFRFHGCAEFSFHCVHLLPQQRGSVVQVHRRWRLRRRDVRQHHADLSIHRELRLTARATNRERVQRLLSHACILRQFWRSRYRGGRSYVPGWPLPC